MENFVNVIHSVMTFDVCTIYTNYKKALALVK